MTPDTLSQSQTPADIFTIHRDKVGNVLAIFDIDDNLYSWIDCFIPAHQEMVQFWLNMMLDWSRDELLSQLKAVHKDQHDTEYLGALKHTALYQDLAKHYPKLAEDMYQRGVKFFEYEQKMNVELFNGMDQAINNLLQLRRDIRANGKKCHIVGLTDAKTRAILFRCQALGLLDNSLVKGQEMAPFFDKIYCREEADTEHVKRDDWWDEAYKEYFVERDMTHKKPDAELLHQVITDYGYSTAADKISYSGDSRSSDALMASFAAVEFYFNAGGAKRFKGENLVYLDKINGLPDEHDERRAMLRELASQADREGKGIDLNKAVATFEIPSKPPKVKRLDEWQQGQIWDSVSTEEDDPDVVNSPRDPANNEEVPTLNSTLVDRLARLDDDGCYSRPRTPTPEPDRQSAHQKRVEDAYVISHLYNKVAEQQGKPHLKFDKAKLPSGKRDTTHREAVSNEEGGMPAKRNAPTI
jgi:hypothetical protein